jgi:hypothetical protein
MELTGSITRERFIIWFGAGNGRSDSNLEMLEPRSIYTRTRAPVLEVDFTSKTAFLPQKDMVIFTLPYRLLGGIKTGSTKTDQRLKLQLK